MVNPDQRDGSSGGGAPVTPWERVLLFALLCVTVVTVVWLVTR